MRIAFLTTEFTTEKTFDGGLANYLSRVSKSLAAAGHEPVVFVTARNNDVAETEGVTVCRVDVSNLLLERVCRLLQERFSQDFQWIWQSRALNRALLERHRESPFDLCHYASYMATALFRSKKIPSVVRLSSYQPLIAEWNGVPLSRPQKRLASLERYAIKRADSIFAPSRLLAEAVHKEIGRPVSIIESPFVPATSEADDQLYHERLAGKTYLLFYGKLCLLKGVITIAEAIHRLFDQYPELYFVFAGRDLGHQGRPMIEWVREKAGNNADRVLYFGQLHHRQLYPIIQHAAGVVLPSRIDNLPNACIEAMGCKRIVIGTREASFDQLIDDGENGFLCERDDPGSLLVSVQRALSLSAEEKVVMGCRAAERVARLHPSRIIPEILLYYQEVIGDHSRLR